MKNPFKVGDKVFITGEKEPHIVHSIAADDACECQPLSFGASSYWKISRLSFKPWPAPCHERPIQDGWWVCTGSRNDEPYIREVRYGKVRYIGREFNLEQYTFHRYLGKDWK